QQPAAKEQEDYGLFGGTVMSRRISIVAVSLIVLGFGVSAESPPVPPKDGILIQTFSIAAVDPETGVCRAAVASRYPAVGKAVAFARAGVGAFCTQHWNNAKWGEQALDLLEKGKLPEDVLGELLRDDQSRDLRQLGIIDMQGRSCLRHPVKAPKGSEYW